MSEDAVKLSAKVQKIVDAVKELIIRSFRARKALETEFGVDAAAPMMMAGAMPAAGGATAEAVEEKLNLMWY
jgi:ribosomal protein L7/L12